MGAWDAGIFENDTSLDYLGDLVERIKTDIENDISTLSDGVLERPFGACLAILRALAVAYWDVSTMLEVGEVEVWRKQLMKWLDSVALAESADEVQWKEYKAAVSAECEALIDALTRAGPE